MYNESARWGHSSMAKKKADNKKEAPSLEAVIEGMLDEKMKDYIEKIVKEIAERIQPSKTRYKKNPIAI